MFGWLVARRTLVSDTVLAMMFRQILSTYKHIICSCEEDPGIRHSLGHDDPPDPVHLQAQPIVHVVGRRQRPSEG